MTFQKGYTPWNKGLTKETDERMIKVSETLTGRKQSLETVLKRAKSNTGKKRSEETKQRIRDGQKRGKTGYRFKLGHVVSEKTRRKLSKALEGRTVPWSKGKPRSKETRDKISESLKGHTFNLGRKIHSEESKAKIRAARLKQRLPQKDTKIEVAIQGELNRRGVVYKKHVPLLGKYQVDVLIDPLIVIECNGDYWHSEEMWDGKTWARDRQKKRLLEEAGYSVHYFWGSEIRADVVGCVDQVLGVSMG